MAHHTRVNFLKLLFMTAWLAMLAACQSGAVVFAPTPAPPDTSPTAYAHPSGAFTATVPQQWGRYEQNTTTLASASFSPPNAEAAAFTIAAMRLDAESAALDVGTLIDRYQSAIRPDAAAYKEVARAAMGDGSWRLDGLRRLPGAREDAVNTFIQRVGDVVGVIEITGISRLSAPALLALESIIDSAQFNLSAALDPAPLSVLAYVKASDLALLHVQGWHANSGAFYITGEVANFGSLPLSAIPIEAGLFNDLGEGVAGAADVVMGHALAPGAFAPFSLRFGEGQAPLGVEFVVRLGAGMPTTPELLSPQGALVWADEAGYDTLNRLVISGTVTNVSSTTIVNPRALATVFDSAENVIGAAWVAVAERIAPGAAVAFSLTFGDLGGAPENYLVVVEGQQL